MSEEPRFQVDVPPVSDARWDALEQRLLTAAAAARARDAEAARTAVRRRWPAVAWAAAGALVAVAITLFVVRTAGPSAPSVATVPSSDMSPLAVVAGAGGATLSVADATITSSPGTRFAVVRTADAGVRVELEHGDVTCEVAPRGTRAPFRVRAGDVDVEVVGTRFTVSRPAEGPVSVEVAHGTVRVARGGPAVAVTAGQAWRDGAVVATGGGADAGMGPEGGADAVEVASGTGGVGDVPPDPDAVAGDSTAPGAPVPAVALESTEARRQLDHAEAIEAHEPETARRAYEALLTTAPRGIAARARYSLVFLDFRAGERHLRAHERDQATAAFQAALRHIARYQRQHPSGKNTADVLRLEVLTYYHLDDPRRREAARRYLDQFPTGTFAEKARQIANWQ